jgi:hypothetical protein
MSDMTKANPTAAVQDQIAAGKGDNGNGAKDQTPKPATYEQWFDKQDPETKELVGKSMAQMIAKNKAISEEREKMQGSLEGIKKLFGSDPEKAKQEMDKLSDDYKAAQQRIEFLEDATREEIQCLNPAAAWLVAKGKNLFNSKGAPDWKAVREEAPELFGKRTVRTHGGDGTGETPPKKMTINDAIRDRLREKRGG